MRVFWQHGGSAEELRHDKARYIGRANPGKGIGKGSRESYRVTAGLAKEVEAVNQ